MARYEPGQSGNPRGRPPKERALTAILQAELGKTVDLPDGRRIAAKRQNALKRAYFAFCGVLVINR